ncbi:PTS sugar transporter subunit IIA [Pectinatus frisingensis]|uniref:PTS sugar transporter subunit IIA n=1 Tax=Pectinatus frisingensis TaxID=865 RepID=UPI003D8046CE
MLLDLLTKKTIKVNVNANDWEDAIRRGGELLKSTGIIGQNYIEAMVNNMKTLGPYIVIAPGIAMPHARPETDVKGLGLSLITLKHPIIFGNKDNDPVKLVFCLAASKESVHIEAIAELVSLLSNTKKIKQIELSNDVDTILKIITDSNSPML